MDLNLDQNLFDSVLNEDYKETLFLLSIGADPNRLFKEHNGISSFHIAVGLENDLKFTRLFIKNNANVNIKSSKDNWTPLHVCSYWNKYDSLQLLLLNQADPFILDKDGKSALDIAKEHNSKECIKILTDFIEKLKLKNQNRISVDPNQELTSNESILSLGKSDPNQSYSNIKTSTFDESHLEYYLSPAKPRLTLNPLHTPPHFNLKTTPNLNTRDDLESLISNLIDIKLEKKERSRQRTLSKQNLTKSISVTNSPISTLTPSKSTCSTQTKITNKRFLSPEKLPAFYSKKEAPTAPPPPPPPPPIPPAPPLPPPPLPPSTKETQTTGKMVKLKNIVPTVPPGLIEELNSKFKEKLNSSPAQVTPEPNKFKNWFNKFSSPFSHQNNSLKPSDYKFKSSSVTSLNKNPESKPKIINKPKVENVKLKKRSSSLVGPTTPLYSNSDVINKLNQKNITERRKVHDGPIQTVTNRIIGEKALNTPYMYAECDFGGLITNDEDSTLTLDSDEEECTKKSTFSSFKTAEDYASLSDFEIGNSSQIKYYESLGYSSELIEELVNRMNTTTASDVIETNMFNCFRQKLGESDEVIEWREGNLKSAFNYLLIDPRITDNLPKRAKYLSEKEVFRIFISSIFYIGKGSRARPYAHLYDTLRHWKKKHNIKVDPSEQENTKPAKMSKKIQRIIEIWDDNKGVVSLHCFQSVIPSEAYTREAAMMDAIGMGQLTNMKKGNYYGESKDWSQKQKNQLGVIMLRRACAIFLAEGERQITPIDI